MTDPEGHPETAILEEVAARHEIFGDALLISPPDLAKWRAEAMTLLRDRLGWTTYRIGEFFGLDHSTVVKAVRAKRP